ncbi:hypothetical protein F4808DRAFT_462053 [Astrocystis sublimbata]|nr:hypothetical protein F4808DRAFT_462053 [Astrocystis sublimbata]
MHSLQYFLTLASVACLGPFTVLANPLGKPAVCTAATSPATVDAPSVYPKVTFVANGKKGCKGKNLDHLDIEDFHSGCMNVGTAKSYTFYRTLCDHTRVEYFTGLDCEGGLIGEIQTHQTCLDKNGTEKSLLITPYHCHIKSDSFWV